MPSWPASLPQSPERDGYAERPGDPVIRAPADGPPLTRRRYTAAPKGYAMSFWLSRAQLAIWEAWFREDIEHGALPYDWRERGDPANPIAQFLIIEEPQIEYIGGPHWRLRLSVIRLP